MQLWGPSGLAPHRSESLISGDAEPVSRLWRNQVRRETAVKEEQPREGTDADWEEHVRAAKPSPGQLQTSQWDLRCGRARVARDEAKSRGGSRGSGACARLASTKGTPDRDVGAATAARATPQCTALAPRSARAPAAKRSRREGLVEGNSLSSANTDASRSIGIAPSARYGMDGERRSRWQGGPARAKDVAHDAIAGWPIVFRRCRLGMRQPGYDENTAFGLSGSGTVQCTKQYLASPARPTPCTSTWPDA